ncbi:MAG TPA: hypothetical protein PKH58_01355 [Paludibacteraceae bacterium]|mgnify:CR=1 FL=1|nr:hypothetical protein [Paludibacteraceae bacterium]
MAVDCRAQLGSNVNLNGLKGLMSFWSDSFNFTTNKLTDKSGNADNAPSLVDSNCLVFNGTSTVVTISGTYVQNIAKVLIYAQSGSDAWTIFTELTAPNGLYSISGNILYIGKNGAAFFAGKIARIKCYSSADRLLADIPLSMGYGTKVYGLVPDNNFLDSTVLSASLEGTFIDTNADGVPDPLIPSTNWTKVTQTIVNDAINGWSGRHGRIDFTTKGDGTYYYLQGGVTPGELLTAGYFKIRFRTNISSANKIWVRYGNYMTTVSQYLKYPVSGAITEGEMYFDASNCATLTIWFKHTEENTYFEYDFIQLRKYAGYGIITDGVWSATSPNAHCNLEMGVDVYVNETNKIYVPKINSEKSHYPGTLTFLKSYAPATNSLIDVETKLQFPDVEALKTTDSKNYLYNSGGTALKLGYSDLVGAKGDYFFSNVYTPKEGINDIVLLKENVTTRNLRTINTNLKKSDKRIYVKYISPYLYINTKLSFGKHLFTKVPLPSLQTNNIGEMYLEDTEYKLAINSTSSLLKNCTDDSAPVNVNGSYVGGNHAYAGMMNVTLVGHDKDASDIGSVWSTGGFNYKLVKIVGNVLSFIQSGTATHYGYKYKTTFSSGTLIHVSGATHTGDISAATTVPNQYISPGKVRTLTNILADGLVISDGFDGYCNELEIQIIENIYNYLVIEDYYPNDLANCPFIIRRNLSYIYTSDGSMRTKETVTALLDDVYFSGQMGIDQAAPLNSAMSGVTKQYFYLPGSAPFTIGSNAYDLRQMSDWFSFTPDTILFTPEKRETGKHINRMVEIISSDAEKMYGFSHGYFLRDNSVNVADIDWYLVNTKKSYPEYATNIALLKDTSISGESFRKYFDALRTDSATCAYIVKADYGYNLYIDVHTNLSDAWISVPSEVVGMNIAIDDSNENITIHSTQVISDGIKVTVINNYGYAVLRLT